MVKREICVVVIKGILIEGEMLLANFDVFYIMLLKEGCLMSLDKNGERLYGVCVSDVVISRIIIG